MIHLDTSFLVDLLRESRRRDHGPASKLLDELVDEPLWISAFVACELAAGVELSAHSEPERQAVARLLGGLQIAYPDARFAPAYGRVFAELRQHGQAIAAFDLLIATAALIDGARLVTRNERDFSRVPELALLPY